MKGILLIATWKFNKSFSDLFFEELNGATEFYLYFAYQIFKYGSPLIKHAKQEVYTFDIIWWNDLL